MAKTLPQSPKPKDRGPIQATIERVKNDQAQAAYKTMAEELFQDYYKHRRDVYKMNFVRGIFFGFGSVIGGTVVVALVVWILSLFINFPLIGQYFEDAQQSFEQTRQNQ